MLISKWASPAEFQALENSLSCMRDRCGSLTTADAKTKRRGCPRMRKISVLMVACVVASVCTTRISAQTPETVWDDESFKHLVVAIKGEVPKADVLVLSLALGSMVTRTVRVYSEPSHTLLFAGIDENFAATADGENWKTRFMQDESAMAFVTTKLPRSQPTVTIPGRPIEDQRVAVWVDGDLQDEENGDRLVADALLNCESASTGDFGFSVLMEFPGEYTHCCQSASCSRMCENCSGPQFTCCLLPNCCSISCGWISGLCADCL